jgi:5-methylcytosine-specific restriction endonuclease McrA
MENINARKKHLQEKRDEYIGEIIRGCTVIDVVRSCSSYSLVLECNECGEVFNRRMSKFLKGDIQACHRNHEAKAREERKKLPKKKPNPNHGKKVRKNLVGKKIGRFTVLEHVGFHYTRGGYTTPKYLCQCECGEKCVLTRDVIHLRKMCDKELLEFKRKQGRDSSRKRANKAKAKGKYKEPNYREQNARKISVFSAAVYEKHMGICQKCHNHFDKENTASHHIIPITTNKSLAFFPSNGILLCKECHDSFHQIFGNVAFDYKKIFDFVKDKTTDVVQTEIIWYH